MTHHASEMRALNAEAEYGRAHACHAHDVRALVDKTEHDRFYPYGKTYGQVFREQE